MGGAATGSDQLLSDLALENRATGEAEAMAIGSTGAPPTEWEVPPGEVVEQAFE